MKAIRNMEDTISLGKIIEREILAQPFRLSDADLDNYLCEKTDLLAKKNYQQAIIDAVIDKISSNLAIQLMNHNYQVKDNQVIKIDLNTEKLPEFKVCQIMYKTPFIINKFTKDAYTINDLCLGAIYLNHKLNSEIKTSIGGSTSEKVKNHLLKKTMDLFATQNVFLKALLINAGKDHDYIERWTNNTLIHYRNFKINLSNHIFLRKQNNYFGLVTKYNLVLRKITLRNLFEYLRQFNIDIENVLVQKIIEIHRVNIIDDVLHVYVDSSVNKGGK